MCLRVRACGFFASMSAFVRAFSGWLVCVCALSLNRMASGVGAAAGKVIRRIISTTRAPSAIGPYKSVTTSDIVARRKTRERESN